MKRLRRVLSGPGQGATSRMPYLNCPRCKLSILIQNANLAIERCPRCLARSGRVAKLQMADRPLSARPRAPARRPREKGTEDGK
jgi:Zn-finger nucleic acid-binding protein